MTCRGLRGGQRRWRLSGLLLSLLVVWLLTRRGLLGVLLRRRWEWHQLSAQYAIARGHICRRDVFVRYPSCLFALWWLVGLEWDRVVWECGG